jgi:hypothetical protein
VRLQRAGWQATKSREKEQRERGERRRDKSISRALQAAPWFMKACPPARLPQPLPTRLLLLHRTTARPRGQLAFLSLAAARALQCTANHGAMTRRGWARGASVGASGGGNGGCCRRRGGVGLPGWLSSSWLKLDPVLPPLSRPPVPAALSLPQPGHRHHTLRYASTTRRCYSHTLPNMEIMYKRSPLPTRIKNFKSAATLPHAMPCHAMHIYRTAVAADE